MTRDGEYFNHLVDLGVSERQFQATLRLAAADCGVTLPNSEFEGALRDLLQAQHRFSKFAPRDWPHLDS
jgi:hypothetical protein